MASPRVGETPALLRISSYSTMLLVAVAMAFPVLSPIDELPLWDGKASSGDWLLRGVREKAGVFRTNNSNEIVLANGLVARKFRLAPNAATVAFDNLVTGETLLRAVKPEAEIALDGKTYPVGGLAGQRDLAYLTDAWMGSMKADPGAFR